VRQAKLKNGEYELFFGAKVVLDHRVIAIPGCGADLAQRNAVQSMYREKPLGCSNNLLFG